MSQLEVIRLLFKITLISGFLSISAWIVVYTRLQKWWHDEIGITLVAKSALIACLFVPSILALFFHLSAVTNELVGWIDVALIFAVTPVMIWRSVVWVKVSRPGKCATPGESRRCPPESLETEQAEK